MLKISLVTLGHLKYSLKVKELTEWKSNGGFKHEVQL